MQRSFYERPALLFGAVFLGFVALSFLVAIGPALALDRDTAAPPASRTLSTAAQRGLSVYVSEGCPYCHTQQVRPLAIDSAFGRPSVAADYARLGPSSWYSGTPAILGSERTGPDLSNVGKRQASEDWQLMHLYNPRAVAPESIMPAFTWLFEVKSQASRTDRVVAIPGTYAPTAGVVVPTRAARDLVAYLLELNQAPLPGRARSPAAGTTPAHSAGATLFADNCAACHQTSGTGIPATFPPLAGNLIVNAADPAAHIATVIHGTQGKVIGGVAYTVVMPPFGALLNDEQIAAVVNHERSSWGNSGPLVDAGQVHAVRESGRRP
ncbi:MAG: cbb3-type cytochrome c oxidase subunit II [Polyangiaceae bacterium]